MKNVTYINAGAGSGKTYRLTETLTKLIKGYTDEQGVEHKVKPEQVILTTFTTKAASEFKEKAKAFLFEEGLYNEAVQLDHAMIGTVHSVCQRLIGKYWFNLGLSPNMGVMAEEDTTYYISQSLAELPTEAELKLLRGFARDFDIREKIKDKNGVKISSNINYDFWQDHLTSIIKLATNYELDDFSNSKQKSLDFVRQFVKPGVNCEFTSDELLAVVKEHGTFLWNQKRQSNENSKRIEKLLQVRSQLRYPTIKNLRDINSTIGIPKGYGPLAESFHERMAGLWTSKLVYDKQEKYIELIFDLAKRWKENYAKFKREKNLLDYDDMEKYMRLLMENDEVANEIAQSYRYLFVDEFQDSSPIQVKIFDALSDLMEHSYWVGDYKQAIYGFRGSDIALTKAVVDRVAKKENGCDTDTLSTSWRSLPDIVELNNAVFCKTFANVLTRDNIHLEQHRTNDRHEDSLRYFVSSNDRGVAEHVAKLLNEGAEPHEIAVLARTNPTLDDLAKRLKSHGIPSSREDTPVTASSIYQLITSLLRIVDNYNDNLAKATVAILTEQRYDTRRIIEEKILNDADALANDSDYLAQVPLVSQLLTIKPKLRQQSVASLVESLIIELNLFNVAKRIEEPSFATSCLQTFINTARVYEEHCVQMNMPATIGGFIAYVDQVKPVGCGEPNGVQLHTYHSCKGLQWKYVILMSLNNNVADIDNAVKREIFGVHPVHETEPTAENPYPDVYIRLTPWLYGSASNTKVPAEIREMTEKLPDFKLAYKSMLEEANRLLYVGMTRPQDVLILDIEKPTKEKGLLQWPKDDGVDTAANDIPESGDWDAFGVGMKFKDFSLAEGENYTFDSYNFDAWFQMQQLSLDEPTFETRAPRFVSPSGIHSCGKVVSTYDFEARIPLGKDPESMATVGVCIHQIFAGIEESRPAYKIEMDEIVGSYGLSEVLKDKDAILKAWRNLAMRLTSAHGPAVKTYHERPFRMERDGQTIVGSIDLVWQTAEGDILIDYKTCPMGPEAVLNPVNEHYAGLYAGQLDAYTDALEAAGEKVLHRYVYYPVSGLLVEIGRGTASN